MPDFAAISAHVKLLAREQGFDLAGIAGVAPHPELSAFAPWIDAGRHGEMQYLAARDEHGKLKRESLQNAAPWARSVIVCAVELQRRRSLLHPCRHHQRGLDRPLCLERDRLSRCRTRPPSQLGSPRSRSGKAIERIAFRSWCYVDTGPIVERVFAKYAGIGWIGKNTCILNQQLGSWLFLGVILTNLALRPTCLRRRSLRLLHSLPRRLPHPCFSRAASSRCHSLYLVSHDRECAARFPKISASTMGRHVFGCDICQDVCPVEPQSAGGKSGGACAETTSASIPRSIGWLPWTPISSVRSSAARR